MRIPSLVAKTRVQNVYARAFKQSQPRHIASLRARTHFLPLIFQLGIGSASLLSFLKQIVRYVVRVTVTQQGIAVRAVCR